MPGLALPRAPKPVGARRGRLNADTQAILQRGKGQGRPKTAASRQPLRVSARPMPEKQSKTIDEPVVGIGQRSGRALFTLGEGGRREKLEVTGLGKKPKSKYGALPGVDAFQTGGTITSSVAAPIVGAAGANIRRAEDALFGARAADIAANRNVVDAQGNVLDARTTELGANRAVIGAESAFLKEQRRATALSRAEEEAIQAAAQNLPDQIATARAQHARADEAFKFAIANVAAPVEIDTPEGAGENLGPGVRGRIQSQEQLVTRDARRAQNLRQFDLQSAQQAAQAANLAARSAGLDVSGAQIAASRASLGATSAGLDVNAANLALDQAQRPPPGMVYDSQTGTFVSEANFRVLQAQRGIEYDSVNKAFVPRQELMDRTDAAGNILRASDNTWVDPRTGNELINGQWVDPKSGNVFRPTEGRFGIWYAPDGNKFIIENPDTGAGYWQDPAGFILKADGVWEHPVTGERIINGVIYTLEQLQDIRYPETADEELTLDSNFGDNDEGITGESGGSGTSTSSGGGAVANPDLYIPSIAEIQESIRQRLTPPALR